jgi:hypothetical protein
MTKNSYEQRVYKYSVPISNYAYLGYVLVEDLFGSTGLADMMLFCLPFGIYTYSFGYSILTGRGKSLKRIINPIIISIFLGMIVGLTEDGKVKMTGDYAVKMKEAVEGWTDIVAIEAGYTNGGNIDYIVTALDKSGTFHYVSLINERTDASFGSASLDKINDDSTWHKYTPDGKEYYSNYDGEWEANEY